MQQQFHEAAGIAGLLSEPQGEFRPTDDSTINTRSVRSVSEPQGFRPTGDLAIDTQSVFEDYSYSFVGSDLTADNPDNENYSYLNAASCPDCSGGMIRLGGCFSCPSCGFESCSV